MQSEPSISRKAARRVRPKIPGSMPVLDFAFLCEHGRAEAGVVHAIAAGLSQVTSPVFPAGQQMTMVMRFTFKRHECDRPHRLELFMQGEDGGEPLMKLEATMQQGWSGTLPIGWDEATIIAVNFGVPLPTPGLYSFELLLNDQQVKSLPLRVLQNAETAVGGDVPDAGTD